MISKFSVLYVGQIELDNIGRNGTPADARRYPNERLIEAFWTAREIAQVMDEHGYYALWTAEHHFQREGYEVFPNLIMLGQWLATQTRRLKFGCGFNVLPMWHPVRLAEDYAFADIVTKGRVIMGVGRGYHSREVESFGAPVIDNAANKELFEEQMEVLMKCFNEESFSHHGKHYTIPPAVPYRGYDLKEITCVPRPVNRPVEIWQPIASGKTLDYIASRGIKGMVTLNGEKIVEQIFHGYRDAAAKAGRHLKLGEDLCWGVGVYLAESQEEAMRRLEPAHDERFKWFAPFGFVRYADKDGRPWGTPGAPTGLPTLRDGVEQRAWLCGPPKHVIEQIKDFEAKYPGLDQMMIHWAEGIPPKEFKAQLKRFAKEVMPAFRSGRSKPMKLAARRPAKTAARVAKLVGRKVRGKSKAKPHRKTAARVMRNGRKSA